MTVAIFIIFPKISCHIKQEEIMSFNSFILAQDAYTFSLTLAKSSLIKQPQIGDPIKIMLKNDEIELPIKECVITRILYEDAQITLELQGAFDDRLNIGLKTFESFIQSEKETNDEK
jgi:hypothetical protein